MQQNFAQAKGDPSKSLFINMLTRDISLGDCVVDLLDNSVDGIKESRKRAGMPVPDLNEYADHWVHIEFDNEHFSIRDNCGGIPIQVAIDYAFRFGRRDEDNAELAASHTIGLYGIGMKRALFKMGNTIDVISSTGTESFEMHLDVEVWRRQRYPDDPERDDWDFPLTNIVRENTNIPSGTSINITNLVGNVSRAFSTPSFASTLIHSLRRQYAFIISGGLKLSINGHVVRAIMPTFKVGQKIAPMRVQEDVSDVRIDVTAGMAASPPEDDSAEAIYPDAEVYGWYVVCNDRVVVAGDKTSLTGWGVSPVPAWHPQFNGFIGVIRFDSDDPRLLPWTTTKKNVDVGNDLYLHALGIMSECTKQFVDYTNKRKGAIPKAVEVERAARSQDIEEVPVLRKMLFPAISSRTHTRRIQYDKPETEIRLVAKALKLRTLSLKEVGIKTFDYYRDKEVID